MSAPDHVLAHAEVIVPAGAPREVWAAERTKLLTVGASEVSALLGIAPDSWEIGSEYALYCLKRGLIEGPDETERMKWGHRLERAHLEGAAEDRGKHEWPELDGRLLRSLRWPWMSCTLDGWLIPRPEGRPLMVQLKGSDRIEQWSDEAPAHVWIQEQAEMAVTGEPDSLVSVLLRGNERREWLIKRDQETIENLAEATRVFIERVKAGEPPPPDGSSSTAITLKRLFPKATAAVVHLPADLHGLAPQRLALREQIKAGEEAVQAIDNRIQDFMKEAGRALLPDGSGFRWPELGAQHCKGCGAVTKKPYRKFEFFNAPKTKKKEG